ncbi:MAG TPA: LURP-one-related family protein [Promineifilum sp.]|nr:LURP-one-related family protein [Promineifilum sp.]
MRGNRAGRPGTIGAAAQQQQPEPMNRREQRQSDRQEFGRGGNAERYKMREKMFSIGDDFWIENAQGRRAYKVNGKLLRVRDILVFEDPNGRELAKLSSKIVAIRDKIDIERVGGKSARLVKDLLNVLGDDFAMKFDGGDEIHLKGNFFDHEYTFYRGRDKIGEVSKKWFRISDVYGVEISQGEDEIMLLAATVAMDQMSHDKGAVDV